MLQIVEKPKIVETIVEKIVEVPVKHIVEVPVEKIVEKIVQVCEGRYGIIVAFQIAQVNDSLVWWEKGDSNTCEKRESGLERGLEENCLKPGKTVFLMEIQEIIFPRDTYLK